MSFLEILEFLKQNLEFPRIEFRIPYRDPPTPVKLGDDREFRIP